MVVLFGRLILSLCVVDLLCCGAVVLLSCCIVVLTNCCIAVLLYVRFAALCFFFPVLL